MNYENLAVRIPSGDTIGAIASFVMTSKAVPVLDIC